MTPDPIRQCLQHHPEDPALALSVGPLARSQHRIQKPRQQAVDGGGAQPGRDRMRVALILRPVLVQKLGGAQRAGYTWTIAEQPGVANTPRRVFALTWAHAGSPRLLLTPE